MSGRFVKSIVVEAQCGPDTLKYTCRPMSKVDALSLQQVRDTENGDEVAQLLAMFDKYVDRVEGAVAEDGSAVDKDTVLSAAFYLKANGDAAVEWSRKSLPFSDKSADGKSGN